MNIKTRKIVVIGMFCAMAYALSAIGNAVPVCLAYSVAKALMPRFSEANETNKLTHDDAKDEHNG